jgi:hypothetical protein
MNIQKDEKNPNVYAKEPHIHSHSVDALRYYCAGRPYPPKMAVSKPHKSIFDTNKNDNGGFIIW